MSHTEYADAFEVLPLIVAVLEAVKDAGSAGVVKARVGLLPSHMRVPCMSH